MLTLDFINVGCGDALLGRTEDFAFLIDCGDEVMKPPTRPSLRLTAGEFLRREKVTCLDLVVLTHFHGDHTGDLAQIAQAVRIDELWAPYLPPENALGNRIPDHSPICPMPKSPGSTVNAFLDVIQRLDAQGCMLQEISRPLPPVRLAEGLQIEAAITSDTLGRRQKATLDEALLGRADPCALTLLKSFLNVTSLRLILTYHGQRIFVPGDAYGAYWDRDARPPCKVLKVPHHASAPSVTEKLLMSLRPETAVVSVSNDHVSSDPPWEPDVQRPSDAAMALLNKYCGKVLYTDSVTLPDGSVTPSWRSVRLTLE